jgi:hypothetical protein
MPCDMGMTGADVAFSNSLTALDRIARLEEALCGLCQTLEKNGATMHPQLQAWFDEHKKKAGCSA